MAQLAKDMQTKARDTQRGPRKRGPRKRREVVNQADIAVPKERRRRDRVVIPVPEDSIESKSPSETKSKQSK